MPDADELRTFLGLAHAACSVSYEVTEEVVCPGYRRQRITYPGADGDTIPAYLLVPEGDGPHAAVVVHHQHHGERHLGKSEVVGLAGDPLQAFAPELVRQGVVVLAPDSICFEDRRRGCSGIAPDPDGRDSFWHYLEMTHRLVQGTTLMAKVLDDAARAVSLLIGLTSVDSRRIGVLGHSYGGNTALFQAAVDARIAFCAASGAVGSYHRKITDGIGLEMALAIPGFLRRFEMVDVVRAIAPRPLLVASADGDPYALDADDVCAAAAAAFDIGAGSTLTEIRDVGGHALTGDRFAAIVAWVLARCR